MRYIVILFGLSLAGCAAQRLQEAKDEQNSADQTCLATYPLGVKGHAVDRTSCIIAARDNFIQKVDPQDVDLEELQDAEQLKLAGEVDAGEITPIDAKVQFARIHTQITSESDNRRHQRTMARWMPQRS